MKKRKKMIGTEDRQRRSNTHVISDCKEENQSEKTD